MNKKIIVKQLVLTIFYQNLFFNEKKEIENKIHIFTKYRFINRLKS